MRFNVGDHCRYILNLMAVHGFPPFSFHYSKMEKATFHYSCGLSRDSIPPRAVIPPGAAAGGILIGLSGQRHAPRQLTDLFLRAADGNANIPQGTFGNAAHLLHKLVIGLAALGETREFHRRQILKAGLIELFPDLPDRLRRGLRYKKEETQDL